jgi:hypothetical protein
MDSTDELDHIAANDAARYQAYITGNDGPSLHEQYETDESRAKAARRASGALGRKVDVDDINWAYSIGDYLMLEEGKCVALHAGNAAYVGDGQYVRNGKPMTDAEVDRLFASDTPQG